MPKLKDIKGQKFGRLTVVGQGGHDSSGKILWVCACECGGVKSVQGNSLVSGKTQSCGCLHKEVISHSASLRFKNLAGQRFGRLVVVSRDVKGYWNTRCDCGVEKRVFGQYLRDGATASCDCLRDDYRKNRMQQLSGQRFGRLLVLRRDDSNPRPYWVCHCDCGVEKSVYGNSLMDGHTQSCGCLRADTVKLPIGEASRNKVLGQYKSGAKERGLVWGLTDMQFDNLTSKNCSYCGLPPSNVANCTANNGAFQYRGIDRIDSSRGYIDGNVVPCCWMCNWMKRNLASTDFLTHIEKIFIYQRKDGVAHV